MIMERQPGLPGCLFFDVTKTWKLNRKKVKEQICIIIQIASIPTIISVYT